jgi:NAD(P)-dependent dehydrogenase (short-subunit alcohol dehydrogenase family)
MGEFQGKIVLVTGAGSGIGRGTALAFAKQGARVVIADIDERGGNETVAIIANAGGEATFQQCDVTKQDSIDVLFAAIQASYGRLDCAVNNAAIDPEILPEPNWDIDLFDRILSINLRSVVLCLKAEIAAMRAANGGAIVNLASFAGLAGIANKPFYCAAKHGVVGLTKSVGLDQAKHGIRVNAVCPGFIQTPMAMANIADIDEISARNPTRRVGQPDDIAAAILYLCSDKAGFVIGQSLAVDGGISIQ